MNQTVCIIQARMGSSRLPGKVMMEIKGRSMLEWVLLRVSKATKIDKIVVATTDRGEDDRIQRFCEQTGYATYRGDARDVLDRYYQAARAHPAEHVVRITSDCPLVDAEIIDATIEKLHGADTPCDYASNRLVRRFPIGLDVEVFTDAALTRAWKEASTPYMREHVTPYIYEVPGRFALCSLTGREDHGHLRWTVDTDKDLEFVRAVYGHFAGRDYFGWRDILAVLDANPGLVRINAGVRQKDYRESERG